MRADRKLLIVEIAGLGWDVASRLTSSLSGLVFHKLEPIFPSVTCVAQASFRTASLPREHGMIANGLYCRDLRKAMFWEQSSALVEGKRFWEEYRARGHRVGMIFWQQSLGENVDLILSPAPIHKHGGGMVQDCSCKPADLYQRLTDAIGRSFNLMHYWGPMASHKSSDWIVAAIQWIMEHPDLSPGLLLAYLPHLDYDLQRFGPGSVPSERALGVVADYLRILQAHAKTHDYDFLVFGDYAIQPVLHGAAFPNRALREAGLFAVRKIHGLAYPDFHQSQAFAMVDHQVAHVFATSPEAVERAKNALENLPGIGEILLPSAQCLKGLDHPRSGELVLLAKEGHWFAYPWWSEKKEAPDYATHVDIHNKPGYDPCELFFGWPPWETSQETDKIQGSHGLTGPGHKVAWASTLDFPHQPKTLIDLALEIKNHLLR